MSYKKIGNEYAHRYIWEKYNGSIPIGYDIHHIDENEENNDIKNLECRERIEHHVYHSTGEKNGMFKKNHTRETKDKIKNTLDIYYTEEVRKNISKKTKEQFTIYGHPRDKKIKNITTGEIFINIKSAKEKYRGAIGLAANGYRKSAANCEWEFIL